LLAGHPHCSGRHGAACALLGYYAEALDRRGRALGLYRQLGSAQGEAAALDSLGYIHY
jgi:hypothetical protein